MVKSLKEIFESVIAVDFKKKQRVPEPSDDPSDESSVPTHVMDKFMVDEWRKKHSNGKTGYEGYKHFKKTYGTKDISYDHFLKHMNMNENSFYDPKDAWTHTKHEGWPARFHLLNDDSLYDRSTRAKWAPSLLKLRNLHQQLHTPGLSMYEKDKIIDDGKRHIDVLGDHFRDDLNQFH